MIARDLRAWLNLCSDESLVTRETIQKPGGPDYVYKIAPGMKSALDELLYDPDE
jgi:predicted transcriptional regulator